MVLICEEWLNFDVIFTEDDLCLLKSAYNLFHYKSVFRKMTTNSIFPRRLGLRHVFVYKLGVDINTRINAYIIDI